MRLSEKGCVHLNEWMIHKLPIDAYEFKPEDFTGAVVLTIAQAKEVAKKLNDVGLQHEQEFGDYDYDALDLADCLEEKIEQAEKKNDR